MSGLVTLDSQEPATGRKRQLESVLDFACGSGSLLLNVRQRMGPHGIGKIFGQEKNITTYSLARMNMLLHGVKDSEFAIHHGDTLTNDWDMLREMNPARSPRFDAVVANPPFSYRWEPTESLSQDMRFKNYGRTATGQNDDQGLRGATAARPYPCPPAARAGSGTKAAAYGSERAVYNDPAAGGSAPPQSPAAPRPSVEHTRPVRGENAMVLTRTNTLLFGLIVIGLGLAAGNAATAKERSSPWAPAWHGAARVHAQPAQAYADTHVLVSSALIEGVDRDRFASSRDLVNAVLLASPTRLPDGSTLAGLPAPTQGADLYRVVYRSLNAAGRPTQVSALVAVPASDAAGGLVVYMHATTAERRNPPSANGSLEAQGALTLFAGGNRVLAMPDYLGYGVNRDTHPFALGRLNAPAGRDLILATRELLTRLGRTAGPALYVTGYSEGGGNALWLGRFLEETGDPTLRPTLITAMSGPYDITGATAHSFLEPQPAYVDNLIDKPFFIGFAAVGAAGVTGRPLATMLRPEFARETTAALADPDSDAAVEAQLLGAAILDMDYLRLPDLAPQPRRLMQPAFLDALTTGDRSDPTIRLWADNDNLDWTPKAPIYVLGVIQDAVVPFASRGYPLPAGYGTVPPPYGAGNAENLVRRMRARGLDRRQVAWLGFDGAVAGLPGMPLQTMDHDLGFVYCGVLAARSFNARGLAGLPMLPDPR